MASEQVAFATQDVNVHRALGEPVKGADGNTTQDVESVVLVPGQSVPLSDLAEHLQLALKAGEVAGLRVVSAGDASRLNAEAELVRAAAGETVGLPAASLTEKSGSPVVTTEPSADDVVIEDAAEADAAARETPSKPAKSDK